MRIIIYSLCALLFYSCNPPNNDKQNTNYLRHVGDIPFNDKIDDPNFEVCNEEKVTVHYAFNNPNMYTGEKPAIANAFKNLSFPKIKNSDGYITIRFLVNCKGDTDRFRVEQLDNLYKEKRFDEDLVNSILKTTQSLDGWTPAKYKDQTYDYYKYLTFKIVDNQIAEVLP